jgi:hypothetical protein
LGTHQDVPKPGLKRLTHLLKPLMAKAAIFANKGEAFPRRMKGKA